MYEIIFNFYSFDALANSRVPYESDDTLVIEVKKRWFVLTAADVF